jgi:NADPH:quinone reductase-like Zn-dependent oxidoreductase
MDIPATMTVVLANSSAPDSLEVSTREVPTPAAGEVLLEVSAAAITSGELEWPETHPFVPAHDVAGTVVSLGADVTVFRVGDAVIGLIGFDRNGALSEYVTVNAADLAVAPSSIDATQAAALPLGALTAWQALVDHAAVSPGQHVLVLGGAGGVGAYAVQLAAHLGARVTATARAGDAELVKSYGADAVIDYTTAFEDQVSDVDVVFDTAGPDAVARSWALLRPGGILVSIFDEVTSPSAAVRGEYFVVEPNGQELAELVRLVDAGALRPVVGRVVPFADAATVFSTERDGHHPGKTVVTLSDPAH